MKHISLIYDTLYPEIERAEIVFFLDPGIPCTDDWPDIWSKG